MMRLINNHQAIPECGEYPQMLRARNCLYRCNRNGCAIFTLPGAHLPDHCCWIQQAELVCRLLEELLAVSNDQRGESQLPGNLGENDGLSTPGWENNQSFAALWPSLIYCQHTPDTLLLIGA